MRQLLTVTILCACLVAPALCQTGAGRAAFYEPPQLFVMTGFIANTTSGTWGTDFIVPGQWTPAKQRAALAAWNKGIGSAYDAERAVLAFKEAGATGVIFYDKWHDGIVPHATRITDYKTERDLVGPTIAASAEAQYEDRRLLFRGVRLQPRAALSRLGLPRPAGKAHGSGVSG